MLLKLAWRNIWRNQRRTIISVLALALGVTAIVGLHSFREAADEAIIRGIVQGLVGDAQVHGRGYQESPAIDNVVADPAAVEAKLAAAVPRAEAEKRVVGAGLAGSGDLATAVVVMGIEPAHPGARGLLAVESGRALGATPAREAVIGSGLARELEVQPGGELVLVGQAADGSLANDRFTVVGIADAGSSDANASSVFLQLADAQSFFALGNAVHQIIVRSPAADPVPRLRGALDPDRLEVLPWTEILPELKGAMDSKARNMRLVDIVVLLIVSLGVLNTMTMSTFERTREFGVLAALGTRPGRILGMVVVEALLQGAIGFCLGLALTYVLVGAIGTTDIGGLGGMDVMGARLPETIRLRVHVAPVVAAAVTTVLTMLAGGLIPAFRASRLPPIEATRYV